MENDCYERHSEVFRDVFTKVWLDGYILYEEAGGNQEDTFQVVSSALIALRPMCESQYEFTVGGISQPHA